MASKASLPLVRQALDLGAESTGGPLSPVEASLVTLAGQLPTTPRDTLDDARSAMRAGADPLGEALCVLRSSGERRSQGAFYTRPELVGPMVQWALSRTPTRLVDVGCGSGRFAAAAATEQPGLRIVAVDTDPIATLLCRATLRVVGARRARVVHGDYTTMSLPTCRGTTAFVGNPPYVRHHGLTEAAKRRAELVARDLDVPLSGLAGLHVHFFVTTAALARPGDVGCLVTSAEWLDVNYGASVRKLLVGRLGGECVHVLDPRCAAFDDAMTTTAIACFCVGKAEPKAIALRRVASVAELSDLNSRDGARRVPTAELASAGKWSSHLTARRAGNYAGPTLRDIARVHRGTATGSNRFFVMTRATASERGLTAFCRPVINAARRIFDSGGTIADGDDVPVLLSLPRDLDRTAHPAVDNYLSDGEAAGVDRSYLARHRTPWWWLGDRAPAPIVATYMARQPPMFALNPDGLVVLNIAHGIYPHTPLPASRLAALVETLNAMREEFTGEGRTYHGGLEKFEPREMERLPVPAERFSAESQSITI